MRPWESVRPAPGARPQGARAGGVGKGTRRSLGGSGVDVLTGVPPLQKSSRCWIRGAGRALRVPGRDTDVVIREDVLPRFWQTIEDDLR